MTVSFIRKDLKTMKPQYLLVSDCIDGDYKIKAGKTKYLPQPNASDTSEENWLRYEDYLKRAVFYNTTSRTLAGLVGFMFSEDLVVETSSVLDNVVENATGEGVSLEQLAKKVAGYALAYGRSGLFVDYPVTEGLVTKAQLDAGDIRPIITAYKPWEIINWRVKSRGAKTVLSLVAISEKYVAYDDGFETREAEQFRVLRLGKSADNKESGIVDNEDVFTVEIWRKDQGTFGIHETYQPRDASGAFLNEIPFVFVGSENNDPDIDKAPLYDLAVLNIAHYRNSADYEESCFIVGQPTPYFSGLTEEWVNDVLKDTVTLGSRGAVPLPENGTAGLLQAGENTMPKEAMEHKERQMVALGAKLVEQQTVQRTATEAGIESASENSILASVAGNVEEAFVKSLEHCGLFVGVSDTPKFEFTTDFSISQLNVADRQQLVAEWQANVISFEEMRDGLRKVGVATSDDEVVIAESEEKQRRALQLMQKSSPVQEEQEEPTA